MSRVRQAVKDDVTELVRLRALLFQALGGDFFNPSTAGDDWREALAAVLKEHLTADTMRILVVDGDDGLAACGIGTIAQWLPGPHLRNGRIGHVIGVVTDPAHRRRGHSRTIMHGLLDWFQEHQVTRVDLHASLDAEPLYRALGFDRHPDPSLCWIERPTEEHQAILDAVVAGDSEAAAAAMATHLAASRQDLDATA